MCVGNTFLFQTMWQSTVLNWEHELFFLSLLFLESLQVLIFIGDYLILMVRFIIGGKYEGVKFKAKFKIIGVFKH